jgi:hypothetical protein
MYVYTWIIDETGWGVPQNEADIVLMATDDDGGTIIVATEHITNGECVFRELPTSGNPYTVIGSAVWNGLTFGKTEGGIMVTPGNPILVNLVMTSPPS